MVGVFGSLYWRRPQYCTGKVPPTPDCKENKLADAGSRLFSKAFSSAARCCVIVHRQSVKIYVHIYNGSVQQNPSCTASCHDESSHVSLVLAYIFLARCKFRKPTINSTPLYSSINRLYAQNPVFETVREESVKVYRLTYNGNVQPNPLCAASCVTKDIHKPLYSSRLYAE